MFLIPIQYHKLKYPSHVIDKVKIKEVSAHFDKSKREIEIVLSRDSYRVSLHTEYSAKERKLDKYPIRKFDVLRNSLIKLKGRYRNIVPNLWISRDWAIQFAEFLIEIIYGYKAKIEIIEIHPPIEKSLEEFIEYYKEFLNIIRQAGINAHILIENRNGFKLSTTEDYLKLSQLIDKENLDLKLIIDFPQLLNAEKVRVPKYEHVNVNRLRETMKRINLFKHNVKAIHLWGQKKNISHAGDINDLFFNKKEAVNVFYEELSTIFKDIKEPLYFIPEINQGLSGKSKEECLKNIIEQLESYGWKFVYI